MGLFGMFSTTDINKEVASIEEIPGAILLDVRSAEEYALGHIPGSRNLPLNQIGDAEKFLEDKTSPIFAYCLSGGRSRSAIASLQKMGYQNVKNIGGIQSYHGMLEK